TYAAMFAAIRQAKDHINLESYIIDDDEVGREFASLLLEQQSRGVQVNVIYDSVGGLNTPKAFFDQLTQAGIAVVEFNPINPLAAKGPWLINNRDHRKLLVVDGKIAFVGGINISSVNSAGSARLMAGKAGVQCCMARYGPPAGGARGRRIAEAVHPDMGKAARAAACREGIFPCADSPGK
ncbi:MAG: phospholipase D-like domain-containing protein, partial [Sulfuritalea sp.]